MVVSKVKIIYDNRRYQRILKILKQVNGTESDYKRFQDALHTPTEHYLYVIRSIDYSTSKGAYKVNYFQSFKPSISIDMQTIPNQINYSY